MKDLIILQYQHLIDHSSPNPLDDLSIAVRGLDAQMSYLKQYDFNLDCQLENSWRSQVE